MKQVTAALAVAAIFALTACGGAKSAGQSSGGGDLTLQQVAAEVGCPAGFDVDPEGQVYTKEAASCTVAGHDVYFYTFANGEDRDAWLKFAESAGAFGTFQKGGNWIAQTL